MRVWVCAYALAVEGEPLLHSRRKRRFLRRLVPLLFGAGGLRRLRWLLLLQEGTGHRSGVAPDEVLCVCIYYARAVAVGGGETGVDR